MASLNVAMKTVTYGVPCRLTVYEGLVSFSFHFSVLEYEEICELRCDVRGRKTVVWGMDKTNPKMHG